MATKNSLQNQIVRKSITMTRRDIADWNSAKRYAMLADKPRMYLLQDIYTAVSDDALLTSQINNRHEQTIARPFELIDENEKVLDEPTKLLRKIPIIQDLTKAILDSELYGASVVELSAVNGVPQLTVISRRNIDHTNGLFYPDTSFDRSIPYRELREYGKWILEFNSGTIGLLNKTVPHVLFKKFAQSCWSELCEIYGIPPRYVKTNTQDEQMLSRAEEMMRDMGAAAAFVIDTTEEFGFAQGVSTNGDVYEKLIRLCNNENSLLISGAVIGQDTENGNYSKEESSIAMLKKLIASDQRMVEMYFNSVVLPAFQSIGWLPQTKCTFRFANVEDSDKLWNMVKEILPYKEVDSKWMEEKFGIPVSDKEYGMGGTLTARIASTLAEREHDFFG